MSNRNEVKFEIKEKIGILDEYSNRETPWKKEVNLVAWNNSEPKIDIRDWNANHERMSRGITLTEEQAKKLGEFLKDRYGL